MLTLWKKSYDQPREHIKKHRYYIANKGPCSQSYGFSSSHVWMWELDYKESWAVNNWCFFTVVLKTLESPLDCKEIQPVCHKGNQSLIFIGRTDVEAETPILWPPGVKNWLPGKRPWCWERLKAGGEGDGRGWDGWIASPTQWTWVWVTFGCWWRTGRPGVLRSMRLQIVGHDWASELKWAWSGRNSTLGISFCGLQYHIPCIWYIPCIPCIHPFLDVGSMELLSVCVPYAHLCKSP